MAEQGVTDEQPLDLDAIEARATSAPLLPAATLIGIDVPQLIAEVRASRAREVELTATFVVLRQQRADRAAERDMLQQRIDKALAWCEKANPSPHLNGDQFKDIRAALTGTEPE